MTVSKLLRYLLSRVFSPGIVEGGGGGAAVLESDPEQDELAVEEDTDDHGEADPDKTGPDAETEAEPGKEAEQDAVDDEVVVSIGDPPETPEEDERKAPEWVRDLRRNNRELVRKQRELEAENARLRGMGAQQPAAVVVGEKPTLEGCDYDADKFAEQLEAWHARKLEADAQQKKREQAEEQQKAQWQTRIDAVSKAVASIKVSDYADAAEVFEDTFSIVQQGIVLGGPEDAKTSAMLRYALGKNPGKAKELAAITDPVKFAFAVAKLETQLKVTPRKTAPLPESRLRASVAGAASSAARLQELHEKAQRTGDYTEYLAAKRKLQK